MSRGDSAYNYFVSGYNCAQSVVLAFKDMLGTDERTAALISCGFGGGMGRMREVCGAFSGVVTVVSWLYGYSDPKDNANKTALYEKIRELADRYRAENGSIICRELLGLQSAEKSAVPEDRTTQYYKKRPCAELCRFAGDMLERFIAENPPVCKQ